MRIRWQFSAIFQVTFTGATITSEQRDELLNFAKRHDLWIITDEVYDRIVYDVDHVSVSRAGYDQTLLINSSKVLSR